MLTKYSERCIPCNTLLKNKIMMILLIFHRVQADTLRVFIENSALLLKIFRQHSHERELF